MEVGAVELAWLFVAALCAGTVDAIAGGGGLITVPALFAAGLPPHVALGTNKGQSVFGAFAALWRYHRAGLVDVRRAKLTFPLSAVGSCAGAALVLLLRPEVLRPLVLVLLLAVAVFLTFRRGLEGSAVDGPRVHPLWGAGGLAIAVGAYDGFFGPGTGTFLIAGFVALLGLSLREATADAKVINFASNLAAVALFASGGLILWKVALPMAVGQFVGAWIGAHVAVKGGAKVIRPVVLTVVVTLVLKVGWDLFSA
ncbi:MAG: TSUP family transporter [Myxococcaceae bacterium]